MCFTTATEIKNQILEKKITCLEVTQAFVEAIEKKNPTLNAFLTLTKESALSAAKKRDEQLQNSNIKHLPLFGVPAAVPDVLRMRGTPTTFGSAIFKNAISDEDDSEIFQLKESGVIILGKTSLAEFGLSLDTTNTISGTCKNPWNTQLSAGGGAAGSASAVAAGLCPFALATDFNGALRMSASYCGVLGLMPTRSLLPIKTPHLLPLTERKFLRKGVIARTTDDIALMLNSLLHENKNFSLDSKKKFKIGLTPDLGFLACDNQTRDALYAFAKELENLGHTLVEIKPNFSFDLLIHFQNLFAADRYVLIMKHMSDHPEHFEILSEDVKRWLKVGNQVTGPQYSMGVVFRGQLEEAIDSLLQNFDFLLMPTMPTPAHRIGAPPHTMGETEIQSYIALCGFLVPFNMSGHPAMTLPTGLSPLNLPIGMQLIGRKYSEERLLALAHQYEKAHPFPTLQ